jgi:serine/threonine protein kinase
MQGRFLACLVVSAPSYASPPPARPPMRPANAVDCARRARASGSPLAEALVLARPDDRALLGNRFGPFLIRARLGQGGMGRVFLAEDTLLGRPVALKLLSSDYALDASARSWLVREARSAAAINHPNVGVPAFRQSQPARKPL